MLSISLIYSVHDKLFLFDRSVRKLLIPCEKNREIYVEAAKSSFFHLLSRGDASGRGYRTGEQEQSIPREVDLHHRNTVVHLSTIGNPKYCSPAGEKKE